MGKSLVVQGKTLEEALNKAALLLHCPPEAVAYELLQAARPGRYGQPGTLCKLRVTPVAPAPPDAADPAEPSFPAPPDDFAVLSSPEFLAALDAACAALPPAELPSAELRSIAGRAREFSGDVTLSVSPLEHDGDLKILGTVKKGAVVRAAGRLEVSGDVETARLEADGDILVDGGVLGTARSAGGSIVCKFAQGARLTALQGDVTVRESALHSHLQAGQNVVVGEVALGGSCCGEEAVQVRVAGSEGGTPSLLAAGQTPRLRAELEDIRQETARLIEPLGANEAVCQALRPSEEAGAARTADERGQLWQAALHRASLLDQLAALARQKSRLLGMMNADKAARICITDRAYPGVKIQINLLALELKSLTQFATFSTNAETGEIRITPYL